MAITFESGIRNEVWDEATIRSKLQGLATAEKGKHWINKDLSVTESGMMGRFFWSVFAKYFDSLRSSIYDVDLHSSGFVLANLRAEIDGHNDLISLFDKAINNIERITHHRIEVITEFFDKTVTQPVQETKTVVVQPAPIQETKVVVIKQPQPIYVEQPAPVYVEQAPSVIINSAPVYIAPTPIYYPPRPIFVAPRPIYTPPRPIYVAPRPIKHFSPVVGQAFWASRPPVTSSWASRPPVFRPITAPVTFGGRQIPGTARTVRR